VAAGARDLHLHPRAADGAESLHKDDVAAALRAVRAAVPGIPVGVTTGGWIEPDLERRLALIGAWEEMPDHASVNFSEEGAWRVCRLLWITLEVDIEAGLWGEGDVERMAASGFGGRCRRLLVETSDQDASERMLGALDALGLPQERLLHGEGRETWPVLERAAAAGHAIRVGLEDTLVLGDGGPARDNAELVAAAAALLRP